MGANSVGANSLWERNLQLPSKQRFFDTVVKLVVGAFIVGVPPFREFYKHSSAKNSKLVSKTTKRARTCESCLEYPVADTDLELRGGVSAVFFLPYRLVRFFLTKIREGGGFAGFSGPSLRSATDTG